MVDGLVGFQDSATNPIGLREKLPAIENRRIARKRRRIACSAGFGAVIKAHTNVSLKLDFVSQKKRAWPSRPCGN